MHVARLKAHHQRLSRGHLPKSLVEGVGADTALVVGGHHGRAAETEVAQGQVDSDMPFRSNQHVYFRRSGKPVPVDVPPGFEKHRVTGRSQACEVGHGGARDEAHAGARP